MRCEILLLLFLFILPPYVHAQDTDWKPLREDDSGWPNFCDLPVMNQYKVAGKNAIAVVALSPAMPILAMSKYQKHQVYKFLKGADLYLQEYSHEEIISHPKYKNLLNTFDEFHTYFTTKYMAGVDKTQFAEVAVEYAKQPVDRKWRQRYYRPQKKQFLRMLQSFIECKRSRCC